ncbi:PREDICTED: uncharacterized protein LOC108557530 [Nicrophorus vespilloides]|uniref:Uncharacterized protein LOC108557530 n=1 Tax=Nicrophorus vespilloides TaxID=110193 RepID=A0ABM1M4Q5_NICVS|nr:PREDICTED: uncharacterized protein LOC108557530 [Nicrophorus vespilloides]
MWKERSERFFAHLLHHPVVRWENHTIAERDAVVLLRNHHGYPTHAFGTGYVLSGYGLCLSHRRRRCPRLQLSLEVRSVVVGDPHFQQIPSESPMNRHPFHAFPARSSFSWKIRNRK